LCMNVRYLSENKNGAGVWKSKKFHYDLAI
jgi:hypothetical protein